MQNRGDGIKSVDYNVQTLGCTIQGNITSAIRLCKSPPMAECEVYLKARANDSDLLGHILMGPNQVRYRPKVWNKIDPNLQNL